MRSASSIIFALLILVERGIFERHKGVKACIILTQGTVPCVFDMAMYYDARPCGFNGLFDDISLEPIKGYYPFLMFSRLYELEDQVECHSESPIYLTAAEKDNEKGIMLAYYNRSEESEEKKILIEFSGNDCDGEWQGELLDENNTMTPFDFKVINGKGEITLLNKSVIYLSKKS